VDGVIGDPLACKFDPNSLVGTITPCGTITARGRLEDVETLHLDRGYDYPRVAEGHSPSGA
jgi:feruloyl esterase